MTEVIIKNHNDRVSKGSRVYHLGDLFWWTVPVKEALDILHSLNGQHYFVYGNHDQLIENNQELQRAFVWCRDLEQIEYQGQKIVLCHYAMRVWRSSHKGSWQLYGHTHAQLPETDNLSCDVGVDAWNYYPVSFEEIKNKMTSKISAGHGDPLRFKIAQQKWNKEPMKSISKCPNYILPGGEYSFGKKIKEILTNGVCN
jgi:calcineurin-like phosphoesterase family protein